MKTDYDTRIKIEIIISMIVILGTVTFFAVFFKLEDKINAWTLSLGMDISVMLLTIISIVWARELYLKFRVKKENKR